MSITRRGFLATLAGAVAVAATGTTFRLAEAAAPKLLARHVSAYDVYFDRFVHRVDVSVVDGGKQTQYGVHFIGQLHPPQDEIEVALHALSERIEHEHGARFDIEIRHGQFDLLVGANG